MNSQEKIPMLLNVCYGGYGFSKKATQMYKERKSVKTNSYLFGLPRCDPISIQIVRELGQEANGDCSDLRIVEIYKELEDYVRVDEYDGTESFSYQIDKYKLDQIKKINNSEISPLDKFQKINEVIDFILPV